MGKIIHGHSQKSGFSPEYRAYHAMKNRCLNPRQARFKDYGARGITICSRWLDGEGGKTGFECFLADMGPKPSPDHSVERRDNDFGYSRENCRWATRSEQARNTRRTPKFDIGLGPMPLPDLVERYGAAGLQTVNMRIRRGWDAEEAILTPAGDRPEIEGVPF